MRKTVSREHYEQIYKVLTLCNPEIKQDLSLAELLTADLDTLREKIMRLSEITSSDQLFFRMRGVKPNDLITFMADINWYGHALVLLSDAMIFPKECSGTVCVSDEMRSMIKSFNQDVVITSYDSQEFIQMLAKPNIVTFGNHTYECKNVTLMTPGGYIDFCMPMEDTDVVFMRSLSKCCIDCNNKVCSRSKNARLREYSPWYQRYMKCDEPYDFHDVVCNASIFLVFTLYYLGNALLKYKEALNKDPMHREHKASTATVSTPQIKPVMQVLNTADEIIIPVRSKYTSAEQHTGSHKSPAVHEVNGFWRRRSKYDDTKIFIKSFARGGSKEERENLSKDLGTKQVVYKL